MTRLTPEKLHVIMFEYISYTIQDNYLIKELIIIAKRRYVSFIFQYEKTPYSQHNWWSVFIACTDWIMKLLWNRFQRNIKWRRECNDYMIQCHLIFNLFFNIDRLLNLYTIFGKVFNCFCILVPFVNLRAKLLTTC